MTPALGFPPSVHVVWRFNEPQPLRHPSRGWILEDYVPLPPDEWQGGVLQLTPGIDEREPAR